MNAETLQRVGVQPTGGYGGWHARTLHGLHGGYTHVARGVARMSREGLRTAREQRQRAPPQMVRRRRLR
jgi:hypothetical protein